MIVQKFGGTSVKDAEAIERLIQIISQNRSNYIVVVSALSGITNELQSVIDCLISRKKVDDAFFLNLKLKHFVIAKHFNLSQDVEMKIEACIQDLKDFINALDVIKEITARSSDFILSYGEVLSSILIFHVLKSKDIDINWINSDQIITTNNESEVCIETTQKKYDALIDPYKNYIMPGFIAANSNGVRTTLGRGGSDLTASIYGVLSKAKKIEIWTDVNGVMTTNPKMIPSALSIKRLSYKEASELAFFGAKVLHPKSILPAIKNQIPVIVRNSTNPSFIGTEIVGDLKFTNLIKGIASRNSVVMINITSNRMLGAFGFLSRVFEVFEKHEISIDLIATSEVSISLTLEDSDCLMDAIADLSEFSYVERFDQMATISVIGEGVKEQTGLAANVFKAMGDINIHLISQGASEVNLSMVIRSEDETEAMFRLHNRFFNAQSPEEVFYT